MTRRRMISFALAVVMLLSTAVIPINAESEIQYTEADLHEMITYADAVAAGHVNRLNDEEDMNTLIFANRDNTKTMYYYGENIKYTDENGTVRDKTNKLTYSNGVYVNENNDINVAIPTSLSSGVTLTYEDIEITMIPEFVGAGSLTSTAPTATLTSTSRGQADNVTYDSVFGSGISVRYTPMYSGIKEDIILSSYTGTYSFDFTIDTNGLLMLPDTALAEAEEAPSLDGSLNADENAALVTPPNWYFATREDPTTPVAWLSEIYIYDSAGNTALGSVSVEQTAASEYSVTVIADKAFLEAETTVYPVTVDPSLTINSNNANVEDATLSSVNTATNYGSSATLSLGGSLKGYIAMRFLGLFNVSPLNSLDVSQIKKAELHFSCGSRSGTTLVYAAQYNPERTSSAWWTESTITYDANTVRYVTPQYSNDIISTGKNHITVTDIVKGWKTNSALLEKGLLLRLNSNTTSNSVSIYSDDMYEASIRPYLVIKYSQNGLYKIKNADTGKYLNITSSGSATMESSSQLLKQYFRMYYNSSDNTDRIYLLSSNYGTSKLMSAGNSSVTSDASNNINWDFVAQADGTFLIMNTSTSTYLTESSGSVSMAARNTSANQTWILEVQDSYDVTVNVKNSSGELIENSYIEILTEDCLNDKKIIALSSGTITITLLSRRHGINAVATGYATAYSSNLISSSNGTTQTLNFNLVSESSYPTFNWPIIGGYSAYKTSEFGYRCYSDNTNPPAAHDGMDFDNTANDNNTVTSISTGNIVQIYDINRSDYDDSEYDHDIGNYVIVKYSNYYIVYMHLNSTSGDEGDSVSQNSVIGVMGNSGTNSVHLHIGIYTRNSTSATDYFDGTKNFIDPRAFFEDSNEAYSR